MCWHLNMGNNSKKQILLPSLIVCFDTEQLVLVPVSVHNNKSLKTQAVTEQELPKYQDERNLHAF